MKDEPAGMAIERAEHLIPELRERLARHGLGEIEIRDGELRMKVTAGSSTTEAGVAPRSAAAGQPVGEATSAGGPATRPQADPVARGNDPVASPGVGYFLYAEGLGPGLEVRAGDVIGHVEVLGVRHDVRAPVDGTVRHLVAETGEAVEYGQTLVELEPAR